MPSRRTFLSLLAGGTVAPHLAFAQGARLGWRCMPMSGRCSRTTTSISPARNWSDVVR